jgi:GLPGLI family protein
MKRLVFFLLVFIGLKSQAQQAFEGTLFIEVLSADSSEIPKMDFEVKLKGSMARMNIHSANIEDYSLIINYETGESIMLKTHNGEKIAVRGMKNLAEPGAFNTENSKLKKVAGYNCRKGKITTEEGSSEVYYSTAFNSSAQFFGAYSNVPGLILELHLSKEGNDQVIRAKKLSKRKVKDEEFIIPNEYREMSESEYELLLPLFPEMLN